MRALIYYIALPFLYLLSVLPFPLFYLFSDLVYFLLFHVIGYRKKVVRDNLERSFPEKSPEEISRIMRKFYRYLCDLILETFKTLTISPSSMVKRCHFTEPTIELFKKYEAEKQSVIIVMGHYGNWEWAGNSFSLLLKQPLYVIYHPLRNKYFDRLMYSMRTRFGTRLIPMKETFREMVRLRKEVNATAFIADQTPSPENAFWLTFLHQDTPVFKGTELVATKLNRPIVYVSVKKKKRGYYEVHAETLVNNPLELPEGKITEIHTHRLEQDILEQPETWLWSHRRWKHRRSPSVS